MNEDLRDTTATDRRDGSGAPAADAAVDDAARWTELMRRIGGGDRGALGELYDAAAKAVYGLALWRTGSTEDASDVVQEVFVRVAEQGPRLHRIDNARSWLLTVAHRAAIDVVRRRSRRAAVPLEDCDLVVGADDGVDRDLDGRRLSTEVARLPVKQRDVIYLRHFAGCTFEAIGRIVGVPTFTAASRYRLGVARLRRILEVRP